MQWFGDAGVADGVGDRGVGQTGNRDDVTGAGFLHGNTLETPEGKDFGGATLFDNLAVRVERVDRGVELDRAGEDQSGQDAAEEVIAVEQGHKEFERTIGIGAGGRDMIDDGLEHWRQVAGPDIGIVPGIAVAARGEQHREVQLLIRRLQADEQVEHLVEHFLRPGILTVDLVDDDDGPEAQCQRFAGDELGLRHRAFCGIDEQDHAIDHRQNALHFATEIGVAGSIDNVDAGAVPLNRRAFGQNRDAALFFEVVRIHRPLGNALIVTEGARLAEQLIDQGGFAVIDVRDYGDIAKLHCGSACCVK